MQGQGLTELLTREESMIFHNGAPPPPPVRFKSSLVVPFVLIKILLLTSHNGRVGEYVHVPELVT
jgi:hypothetical protein